MTKNELIKALQDDPLPGDTRTMFSCKSTQDWHDIGVVGNGTVNKCLRDEEQVTILYEDTK